MNASKVFHVAGEPIKGLHNENIKFVLTSSVHEMKQTVTAHDGAAGARSIIKGCDNVQPLTCCIRPA